MYNSSSEGIGLDFSLLCQKFGLGELVDQPIQVMGGLLHQMFCIKTTKGLYAMKALNPQIMARPKALNDIRTSEKIARIAFENGLPALPALIIGDEALQKIDERYFLVFDWFEGSPLPPTPAKPEQARLIGFNLGRIHQADFGQLGLAGHGTDELAKVDWAELSARGNQNNLPWAEELQNSLSDIAKWTSLSLQSSRNLQTNIVISHGDLDQKNVLWRDEETPMIIDWESAGPTNPTRELVEVALYWGGQAAGTVNHGSFSAVIEGYLESGAKIKDDWYDALQCGYGALGWLKYSILRSLGDEVNNIEEQELGARETLSTLKSLHSFSNNIDVWHRWLEELVPIRHSI